MRPVVLLLLAAALLPAQERIDSETNWKLRREATERSEVMRILHVLADRYGARLTGSPTHEAAAKWAAGQLTAWGLKNARLEPWEFGHPGWSNARAAGYLVSPVRDSLVLEVVAWTPSTDGAVTGGAVHLVPPERPTKEELTTWMAANQAAIRGRMVLLGKSVNVPVSFNATAKRQDEADLRARFDPVNPAAPQFPGARGPAPDASKLTPVQADEMLNAWLVAGGAQVRINDAGMAHGMIRAFHNRTYDVSKAVPTVVLRNEDFGRIARLLADNEPVELEFNILNQLFPAGKTTYNVVAEIPGTDKADEVVMLGGHLDSWHSATGATDNAAGSAMMMEAVRLIQKLGLKPRRTIRIGLWSAEEQGLLGSKAYVKEHFGTFEQPKADFAKFVAYLNIDSGTGRPRGANLFGPPEAAAVLRAALAPFADLGVVGAIATDSRREGGTDSTSFNAAGLAGVGIGQDPIEYFTHTWHTNLDTYERIVPEDAVNGSVVAAAAVWHLANRDEALPRFSNEKMPKPAAPPAPAAAKPATAGR